MDGCGYFIQDMNVNVELLTLYSGSCSVLVMQFCFTSFTVYKIIPVTMNFPLSKLNPLKEYLGEGRSAACCH